MAGRQREKAGGGRGNVDAAGAMMQARVMDGDAGGERATERGRGSGTWNGEGANWWRRWTGWVVLESELESESERKRLGSRRGREEEEEEEEEENT